MVDVIQVRRLLALYDPYSALGLSADTSWIAEVKPQSKFIDGVERSLSYHRRRIRFFVDMLKSDEILDPITIDNDCHNGRVYPYPIVLDGHHRFIAHLVLNRRFMAVLYSGRTDVLSFLKGRRKTAPAE